MLFYLPDFSNPVLPESESRHCIQVLRKTAGDTLLVGNGKGEKAEATIVKANPKACELNLSKSEFHTHTWKGKVFLAIAPTKNLDRMEWLVEKATEMGCNGFYFIRTARTERNQINVERLEKVALAAMKQSGQYWLPEIHWVDKLEKFPFSDFSNHWFGDLSSHSHSSFDQKENGSHLFWIGPEGDFTPAEWGLLREKGALGISLSSNILRTETAGLAAVFLFHFSK